MPKSLRLPKWLLVFPGLVLFVLTCSILLGADIYAYSFVSDSGPADAAIVLGAGVLKNEPSPAYKERINHAIDLYKAGRVKYLILTGGTLGNAPVAEALAARDYATQNGVAPKDALTESHSTDTFENFCYSRDIVERQRFARVLVVSDPLHMRRAMSIARELGINAYPSPTPTARYGGWEGETAYLMREIGLYARDLWVRPLVHPEQRCPRSATQESLARWATSGGGGRLPTTRRQPAAEGMPFHPRPAVVSLLQRLGAREHLTLD